MYLLKRNQMKKRKSMRIFWARKFYHENEKEREILKTLLWIFTFSYNTTIAFLYVIPYYFQKIRKIIFYGRPQSRKGVKIKAFIKNKIICIRLFTLNFFCVLYFDLNTLPALWWVTIWLVKKSVVDVRVRASYIKKVQMSCTIKATRGFIDYCTNDKLRILRIEC